MYAYLCACISKSKINDLRIANLVNKSIIYVLLTYHVPWMTQSVQRKVPEFRKLQSLVGEAKLISHLKTILKLSGLNCGC